MCCSQIRYCARDFSDILEINFCHILQTNGFHVSHLERSLSCFTFQNSVKICSASTFFIVVTSKKRCSMGSHFFLKLNLNSYFNRSSRFENSNGEIERFLNLNGSIRWMKNVTVGVKIFELSTISQFSLF